MFSAKAAAAAVLAVAAFAAALIVGNRMATVDQPGGTLVVLVGLSPSERESSAAVKECAEAAIIAAIDDGATLYVAPVGPASVLEWKPINTRLTGAARSNGNEADKQVKALRGKAAKELSDVLGAPPPEHGSSDVFAAARGAGRLLRQEPGPRTLVVCSDMHAVGSGLNLYRDRISDKDCPGLARRLRARWGNLNTVKVVAGAAGLDRRGEVPPRREAEIERFWTTCWSRSVGAVQPMAYDSVPHV